jgi:hypothetical protein
MCTSGQRLGACKAPATVRLVCSGWKCRHDALVMCLFWDRMPPTRAGADRVGAARRWLAGAQLLLLRYCCRYRYFSCYCLKALTDEVLRAV